MTKTLTKFNLQKNVLSKLLSYRKVIVQSFIIIINSLCALLLHNSTWYYDNIKLRTLYIIYSLMQILTKHIFYKVNATAHQTGVLVSYLVIWVSMKSRINISMAGTIAANINHTGRDCDEPSGLINQFLLSGAVGDTPSGTSSFYKQTPMNTSFTTLFQCSRSASRVLTNLAKWKFSEFPDHLFICFINGS